MHILLWEAKGYGEQAASILSKDKMPVPFANRENLYSEEMNKIHFSSKTPVWATPQDFFDKLNAEFNFTLDPCTSGENAKCKKFFTDQDDGLVQDWSKDIVFCNPPYGRVIGNWVRKCATGGASVVVALLPARTDTRWFHEYILGKAEIRFIKGRLKVGDCKNPAPFPSMVVIFRK